MTLQLLIFSPVFLAFFWFVTYLLFNKKGGDRNYAFALFFCGFVYFFTDCTFSSVLPSMRLLAATSLMAQFFAPCLVPLAMTYLWHLYSGKPYSSANYLWLCAPLVLFCSELLLVHLIGFQKYVDILTDHYLLGGEPYNTTNSTRLLFFLCVYVFRLLLGIEMVTFLLMFMKDLSKGRISFRRLWEFFFKDQKIQVKQMQYLAIMILLLIYMSKVVFTRDFLANHPWVAAVLSASACVPLYFFGLFGTYNENKAIKLGEVSLLHNAEDEQEMEDERETADFYMQLESSSKAEQEHAGATEGDLSQELPADVPPGGADDLRERFDTLMISDKLYLTQGLTLSDVAEKLHSNKTYVSRLVNSVYGLPFPEYLNTLRIDYAEEYILHNRDAKQTEIAEACGFPSASAFNNTFKKITGVTPRIWLAMRNK